MLWDKLRLLSAICLRQQLSTAGVSTLDKVNGDMALSIESVCSLALQRHGNVNLCSRSHHSDCEQATHNRFSESIVNDKEPQDALTARLVNKTAEAAETMR